MDGWLEVTGRIKKTDGQATKRNVEMDGMKLRIYEWTGGRIIPWGRDSRLLWDRMDLRGPNLRGRPTTDKSVKVSSSFRQRTQSDLQINVQRNVDVNGPMCFQLLCVLLYCKYCAIHQNRGRLKLQNML